VSSARGVAAGVEGDAGAAGEFVAAGGDEVGTAILQAVGQPVPGHFGQQWIGRDVGLDLGGSAAQSVVLMAIVISLTAIQFRFIERKVNY